MSTTSPPPVRGQIEAPNPVELFWEKHRRAILLVVGAIAVAFASSYGLEYMERQRQNAVWAEVANATRMDKGYSEMGSLEGLLGMQQQGQQLDMFGYYFQAARNELVTELGTDLAGADESALQKAAQDLAGTGAEPLLLWVQAYRHVEQGDWDAALGALASLEQKFPDHFLCASTDYPPQFRPEVEKEDPDEEESEAEQPSDEPPELEAPVAGSPVALLRTQIEKQKAFEQAEAGFYSAPAADAEPTVVVKLSNEEQFTIGFYRDLAPEHVDAFLANVREGFYVGQAFDEVHRRAAQNMPTSWTEQLHLGLAASKSDDRATWATERAKDSPKQLEFEDNDLSHFAGMLAAHQDTNGKSSGTRVWITTNDCAVQQDGNRVIFGRVVEGLEALQNICREQAFVDEAMSNQGRGQLQANFRILSMDIVNDIAPPPAKENEEQEQSGNEQTGGGNKPGGGGND